MENVEFNPDDQGFSTSMIHRVEKSQRGVSGLVTRIFGAKDENYVNLIMIIISIIFFVLSAIIIFLF